MARPTNRQLRHVGNLGDVLKHAALVELAGLLAKSSLPVSYVETHSFLLHAPLNDVEKWSREVDGLASKHPVYAGYAAREREYLAERARYRCSSGLVMDVLGERRICAVLSEANAVTRAELTEQVSDEHLANAFIVDDATAIDRDARVQNESALLVHVDPFSLSPELWRSIVPALDAMVTRSVEAAIVVYRYTRSAPSPWPAALTNMRGPVAQTRGGPHEIAAYASPGIARAVRDVCASLGWRLEST